MVDELMICVDRLIASACFDPVNERESLFSGGGGEVVVAENNRNLSVMNNSEVAAFVKKINGNGGGGGEGCSKKMVRECRICQEEDEEQEMEAPCACNGTLK
ncbi:hypothetical protein U1Q18_048533, partial [Sarracenia purpurea var. burkii]